eukprot:sb/3467048/
MIENSEGNGYGATDPPPTPKRTLNEVYETIGMGRFQYLMYTLIGLVGYSDYAELALLSVLMPAIRCEWGLTNYFEAAITLSVFVGYAVSSGLFGKVGDMYGRKPLVLTANILLLVSAVGTALAPNKWVFLAGRTLTGCCIGVTFSSMICYGTEYAEGKYRAFGVYVLILTCFIGGAAVNILAYLLLNTIGWRWFILVVSIPIIPALVLTAILPESPRYLCVSGKVDELNKLLEECASVSKKIVSFAPTLTDRVSELTRREGERKSVIASVAALADKVQADKVSRSAYESQESAVLSKLYTAQSNIEDALAVL